MGGDVTSFKEDIELLAQEGAELGLFLNSGKSEVVGSDLNTIHSIHSCLPGAPVVPPTKADFLGSPIGDVSSISRTLSSKCNSLSLLSERLDLLSAQEALLLLKHSLALPKLLYTLRTAPCFLSAALAEFEKILQSILSKF